MTSFWNPRTGDAGSVNPDAQQGCYTQSIQPRGHIVEDDSPAFGKAFELAGGERLGDIEEPEEDQGDQRVAPVGGAEEQRDPLPGNLVDDHEAGVVAAGFARGNGGGGHAEDEGEGYADEENGEQRVRRGMEGPGVAGPEQHRGHRAPGAGPGLAEARAEEGRHRPRPEGSAGGRRLADIGLAAIRHGNLR